jgi:hypothetical protein
MNSHRVSVWLGGAVGSTVRLQGPGFATRKRIVRSLLLLRADAPDPTGYKIGRAESGLHTLEMLDETERAADVAAWHAEDWRADAADFLVRLPGRTIDLASRARSAIRARESARLLSRARTLRYTSPYIHATRACADVEGYFDLDSRRAFALQIVAAGTLPGYALGEWENGAFVSDETNLLGLAPCIYVPSDTVTPELVREAIARWYCQRFEFDRRHWTHLTGQAPKIEVHLQWSDDCPTEDVEPSC